MIYIVRTVFVFSVMLAIRPPSMAHFVRLQRPVASWGSKQIMFHDLAKRVTFKTGLSTHMNGSSLSQLEIAWVPKEIAGPGKRGFQGVMATYVVPSAGRAINVIVAERKGFDNPRSKIWLLISNGFFKTNLGASTELRIGIRRGLVVGLICHLNDRALSTKFFKRFRLESTSAP